LREPFLAGAADAREGTAKATGVQLPTATGTNSKYGCSQTACYVAGPFPAGIAYPNNHLYGVVPSPGIGLPTSAGGPNTDIITVVYTDNTYALNLYKVTAFGANGVSISLIPPNPQPVPAVPPLLDPAYGIKVGDLILLSNNKGSAIGEVTGIPDNNTINFADLDPLRINQSGAATGNIKAATRVQPNLNCMSFIGFLPYFLGTRRCHASCEVAGTAARSGKSRP